MAIDVAAAMEVLTDAEKKRIACIWLTAESPANPIGVNWEEATKAYGAASVESMKVSLRNTLKKLEGTTIRDGTAAATPATKKTPAKKRKAKEAQGADADDEVEAEIKPKKRCRKPKATKTEVVEDNGDEPTVKEEAEEVE